MHTARFIRSSLRAASHYFFPLLIFALSLTSSLKQNCSVRLYIQLRATFAQTVSNENVKLPLCFGCLLSELGVSKELVETRENAAYLTKTSSKLRSSHVLRGIRQHVRSGFIPGVSCLQRVKHKSRTVKQTATPV